jgi:hypothetical protein
MILLGLRLTPVSHDNDIASYLDTISETVGKESKSF